MLTPRDVNGRWEPPPAHVLVIFLSPQLASNLKDSNLIAFPNQIATVANTAQTDPVSLLRSLSTHFGHSLLNPKWVVYEADNSEYSSSILKSETDVFRSIDSSFDPTPTFSRLPLTQLDSDIDSQQISGISLIFPSGSQNSDTCSPQQRECAPSDHHQSVDGFLSTLLSEISTSPALVGNTLILINSGEVTLQLYGIKQRVNLSNAATLMQAGLQSPTVLATGAGAPLSSESTQAGSAQNGASSSSSTSVGQLGAAAGAWASPGPIGTENPNVGNFTTLTATATAVQSLNAIRFADQFPGSDCGSKINAANTELGGMPGEIWVNQNCGTLWTTPVLISTNHRLHFVQGGTYTTTASVTLRGPNSAIVGTSPAGSSAGGSNGQTILAAATGAGINTAVLMLEGSETVVRNLVVDGNASGRGTIGSGAAIQINNAVRTQVLDSTAQNAASDGLALISRGNSNNSCCSRFINDAFMSNDRDGIYSSGSSDIFVSNVEVENNGVNGVELSDSATWRVMHSDIGGNGSAGGTCGGTTGVAGLCVYGTAIGRKSNGEMISMTQFGNQYQSDIKIVGHDTTAGAVTSVANIIASNYFLGSSYRNDDVDSDIVLIDGGQNTIVGNFIGSAVSPHRSKYGIFFGETLPGRMLTGGQMSSNTFNRNFAVSQLLDATSNGAEGLQVQVRGSAGPNSTLDLFDITPGAESPHKYIRVSNGDLQVSNSAFDQILLSLTETGVLNVHGSVRASGLSADGAGISAAGALSGVTTINASGKATLGGISTGGDPLPNHAVCWKTSTTLGYCSNRPDASGNCSCN